MQTDFDLLIGDFNRAIARRDDPERIDLLLTAASKVSLFQDAMLADLDMTKQLVQTTSAIRDATGAGRIIVEEELMKHLVAIARQCAVALEGAGIETLPGLDAGWQAPPTAQPAFATLQVLSYYALDCLLFRRAPDSAGGRRRALAFEILAHAGRLINLPEALVLARKSLRKVNSREAVGALQFLNDYFVSREAAPDEQIVDGLLALSQATLSRSTAHCALCVLVATHGISQSVAEDYMAEWREKHSPWYRGAGEQ